MQYLCLPAKFEMKYQIIKCLRCFKTVCNEHFQVAHQIKKMAAKCVIVMFNK